MSTILLIGKPGAEPRRYPIEDGMVNRIGRDPENDVMVRDPHMSSFHAELTFDAEQNAFVIRDLDSRNGTKVEGRRIEEPVTLRDGDSLSFGLLEATLSSSAEKPPKRVINGNGALMTLTRVLPPNGNGVITVEKVQETAETDGTAQEDQESAKIPLTGPLKVSQDIISSAVGVGGAVFRKTVAESCCVGYRMFRGWIKRKRN